MFPMRLTGQRGLWSGKMYKCGCSLPCLTDAGLTSENPGVMRMCLLLLMLLLSVAPGRNAFFDEKCFKLNGRCVNACHKNEELVAFCQKALKCCLKHQPCSDRRRKRSAQAARLPRAPRTA